MYNTFFPCEYLLLAQKSVCKQFLENLTTLTKLNAIYYNEKSKQTSESNFEILSHENKIINNFVSMVLKSNLVEQVLP